VNVDQNEPLEKKYKAYHFAWNSTQRRAEKGSKFWIDISRKGLSSAQNCNSPVEKRQREYRKWLMINTSSTE